VADENVYNLYGKTFEDKFRATGKTLFVKVAIQKSMRLKYELASEPYEP